MIIFIWLITHSFIFIYFYYLWFTIKYSKLSKLSLILHLINVSSLFLLLFLYEHLFQARHPFFTKKFNIVHRDVLIAHRTCLLNVSSVQHSFQVTVVDRKCTELTLPKVVSHNVPKIDKSLLSRSDTERNKIQTFRAVILIIWNGFLTEWAWRSRLWRLFIYRFHRHFLYLIQILLIYLKLSNQLLDLCTQAWKRRLPIDKPILSSRLSYT